MTDAGVTYTKCRRFKPIDEFAALCRLTAIQKLVVANDWRKLSFVHGMGRVEVCLQWRGTACVITSILQKGNNRCSSFQQFISRCSQSIRELHM